jgi:hypothetical protein
MRIIYTQKEVIHARCLLCFITVLKLIIYSERYNFRENRVVSSLRTHTMCIRGIRRIHNFLHFYFVGLQAHPRTPYRKDS